MAQDSQELVVASQGDVLVAPVGTAIPTTPTAAPNAAFVALGYCTDDGVTFNRSIDIEEFMAWQSSVAVRREVTSQEVTAEFALEQWNSDNFALAFGGGEVTQVSAGVHKYEFPSPEDALDERALLLRWNDGDKNYQLAFERGTISDEVEVALQRSELSVLPIAYKALSSVDGASIGVTFVTDDPAFEPIS